LDYIDHFIFVSKFSQSKHCEYDLRFKEKSSQLYNFVPSPVNRAKSTKGSYFLYFGRLSDEKGIKTLLLAFSETTYNLKIAGMGPLVDVVKRYEQTNENINYAGFQTGEKLQKLILNASFVVIPSEWYENNPMSIIESFALQKPVMGANIGGIPELITNDINGYLFNTCNIGSLVRTLKEAKNISDQKYIDLANSAWEFAQQKFDSEIYYRNLLNIYKNVIENKR
jgi:glycosyltransferase involved in cell wall biosynthesis